ncbi:MAG: hypothetical protein C5S38_03405 [Candidatus Methanophagaceae archaeon]|nr:MAG: hypothetical protein C5S38_03405 [Methanophagales archaeon]KAF5432214.1 hypothetical protein C5S36_08950 [Methanophagales archaeon]
MLKEKFHQIISATGLGGGEVYTGTEEYEKTDNVPVVVIEMKKR